MFKPGYIRKIVVRDFVTYSYVEMYPGPNLNMVIGPNGTGKSTIVAAIILGLGGNPKTIGRGSRISEYVKLNCQEATIDIYLQSNNDDRPIRVTRQINIQEKSSWALNERRVTFKEIENIINRYNIQVNNLCQFLPQDKVQDFSKMNKQELLKQTQIAICRTDLYEKQLKLIEFHKNYKDKLAAIENSTQKLQELHDANLRIEEKVKSLALKQDYLNSLKDVERKSAWLLYIGKKLKTEEIKADKAKAAEVLNRNKAEAKPIEHAIKNAKNTIAKIQQKVADAGKIVRRNEVLVYDKLERHKELKNSIARTLEDLNLKLQEIEGREQEINETVNYIEQCIQHKQQLLQTYGDDVAVREAQIKEAASNLKILNAQINKLVAETGNLENRKRNKTFELRAHQTELDKLENVKQQRLEWLRRKDKDAYAAVQWLRANRNMLRGEVFEPMILELNVLNPKHAIFIENMIPMRDRIAFTCVLKEDMNMLVRVLRDQQKLNVNVVHSGNEQPPLNSYHPAIPIEQLKRYGLYAYINTLVTGPEPIMKYLCKTYQIHNTPVGTSITNQQFESVPSQITHFFSDTYNFSTLYSKYTGQKSTRQTQIKSDGSFSISVDAECMETLRGQIAELQRDCKSLDEQAKNLNIQVNNLNDKQSGLRETMRELQKCNQDIQATDSKIRVLNNKLAQIRTNTTTRSQVQNEYQSQVKAKVLRMVPIQTEIKEAFKNYSDFLHQFELDRTNLETSQKQVNFLENKYEEIRHRCQQAEETLTKINREYMEAKNVAKVALQEAKQLSDGFTPTDEGFNKFRPAYDQLTDNLQELQAEKNHLTSKINCLRTADMDELRQYENRKLQINQLQNDIEHVNTSVDRINTHIDNLQSEWFEPLQELVEQINMKFSSAFRKMGCVGEISISKGEDEKDFAQYGLSIKVKYRDAEPLQELNNVVQSGGERSVATAAFMLSLQELTPVPFRCVDEINQGMDSNNERRIFELLVDATSQPDTPQCFFITPKLVPKLKFVRSMKIHFVHNGPFVASQSKWNRALPAVKEANLECC